jgi:hypothetical protein
MVHRYVQKRARLLSRVLKALLRRPLLRGDKYLMYFLTEGNKDRWKKCITEMKKEAKIKHVSQLVTAEGFVDFASKENEVT